MYFGLRLVARPLMLAVTLSVGSTFFANVEPAQAVGPVASPPYTLGIFKGVPPSGATQPDDIAVSADGADLWVGYGNGVDTFGKGGPSNLVEYDISTGAVLQNLTIPGHLDGLKIRSANRSSVGDSKRRRQSHADDRQSEDWQVPDLSCHHIEPDHRRARRPRLFRAEFSIRHRFISG